MSHKNRFRFVATALILLAIGFAFVGCSEKGSVAVRTTHPEGWMDSTAADFHGKSVFSNGATMVGECQQCHGTDLKGGDIKESCFKCHSTYPHSVDWMDSTSTGFHGQMVVGGNRANLAGCRNCHGNDPSGGRVGKSCIGCHTLFPHKTQWVDSLAWNTNLEPDFHGQYMVTNGFDASYPACQTCHGSNYTGGQSGSSCFKCHDQFPHTGRWNRGNYHGPEAHNLGYDYCRKCHKADNTGGQTGFACYKCHDQFPHFAAWTDSVAKPADFHGNYILADRQDSTASLCAKCHGTDYTGGTSDKSCFKCHDQYPHPANWMNPASHGTFTKNNGSPRYDYCRKCHGDETANGGNTGIRCYSCHDQFPHKPGFETGDGHGRYLLTNGLGKIYSDCADCHGVDLKGGTTGVSCYTCHSNFPHENNWADSSNQASPAFHGSYLLAKERPAAYGECRTCHAANNSGGPTGYSCFQCHNNFPHPDEWGSTGHGSYVMSNGGDASLGFCRKCHGDDLRGGSSQISCYQCHQSFPHPATWADTTSGDFHGRYLFAQNLPQGYNDCRVCHKADSSGGITGYSCYQCHSDFPHPAGWSGNGSPNLHKAKIKESYYDLGYCKKCHGSDYRTNLPPTSDRNCYSCHTQQAGPEACNTCHGSQRNAAPPIDLAGQSGRNLPTVGSHQEHLNGRSVSDGIDCNECHALPASYSDSVHIDGATPGVADIVFGEVAQMNGVHPTYDHQTGTCSATYCHGNFPGGNGPQDVSWNSQPPEDLCNWCHGYPPNNQRHANLTHGCTTCHAFTPRTHVNGEIDFAQ